MLISVIVPAYNSEKKLSRCLDSLLQQTAKDFEVIVVNDGSNDGTEEIIRRYCEMSPKIIGIRKENGGVSSARNAGLDKAKGKYVIFVDSDDYVKEDMLEGLYKAIEDNQSDIAMAKVYHADTKTGGVRKHNLEGLLAECASDPKTTDSLKKIIIGYALHQGVAYSNLAKIYRNDLIQKHQIRFDTSLSYCEDVLFNLQYFRFIRSACVCDCFYYYAEDSDNSLTKRFDFEMVNTTIKVHYEFISYFEEMKQLDQGLKALLDIQLLNDLWDIVFRLLSGKYVSVEKKTRRQLAVKILRMTEMRSLMNIYNHYNYVCGKSQIGKIARIIYSRKYETQVITVLAILINLRERFRR